jgi:prepilin-type N-terminal cleavage/methylation domain-containing protein
VVSVACERKTDAGLTLVEVVIAIALFTLVSVGAAHLLVWVTRAMWSSGAETITLAAAQAKLEELESLAWRWDEAGNRVSDLDTDLTGRTPASGGPGLAVSPPNTLDENVDGYVDYLDERGQWVGTGPSPPDSAAFARRWQVRTLAAAPDDTLIFRVLVVSLANNPASGRVISGRGAGESVLTTARTRLR